MAGFPSLTNGPAFARTPTVINPPDPDQLDRLPEFCDPTRTAEGTRERTNGMR